MFAEINGVDCGRLGTSTGPTDLAPNGELVVEEENPDADAELA